MGAEMGIKSDMVTNYRGIAALWLAFCLLGAGGPVFAEIVRSGEFSLPFESAWQRAGSDEEQSSDSIILRQRIGEGGLEVYLPLHRVHLNTSPQTFFDQLDRGWKLRYGDGAVLEWRDIGGTRWRVCRRLSLESDSVLFQLVTVRGDEAYQVVAMVPPGIRALPDPVSALLQQGSWGDTQPLVMVAAPVKPVLPAPIVAPAKPPQPDVAAAGKTWHLLRQVVVRPGQGQWAQISSAESLHFGTDGLITGLGMQADKNGLDWFLEGMAMPGGKSGSVPQPAYQSHWRLKWAPLPDVWREGESQAMALTFTDALETAQAGNNFGVRIELQSVCAPRPAIVGWLNALEQGQPDAMSRIGPLTSGCRPQIEKPAPIVFMTGADSSTPGNRQPRSLQAALPLSATWADAIQARDSGSVRRFILVMHFMTSTSGKAPGDALLNQTAVIFVFGPDS
jgi:hypothetical protein